MPLPSVPLPSPTLLNRLRLGLPACRVGLLTGLLTAVSAWGQAAAGASAEPQRAVLVELFTSEGCSSCPPADGLLRAVNGKRTADGQLIVGLSEHVTYWNQLGWRDRFSSDVFTDRQNRYAENLHLDEVYTPQMVVNGREQFVGSNGPALKAALHREANSSELDLQIISVQAEPGALTFRFRVGPLALKRAVEIVAVITDDTDRSEVTRGENAGTALEHVAVARLLAPVALVKEAGGAEKEIRLPLPSASPASVGAGHHLVLLAQEPGTGAVLGTAVQALR